MPVQRRLCGFLLMAGGEVIEECPRNPVLSPKLSSSTWRRALGLQNNSKCYYILPWVASEPSPKLHHCFLSAPPLSLHPLPSTINNYLNLPFENHRRSRKLNKAYFLQTRNIERDIERIRATSSAGSCLVSISPFPGQVPTTKNEK